MVAMVGGCFSLRKRLLHVAVPLLLCWMAATTNATERLRGASREAQQGLVCRVLHVDEYMKEGADHLECELVYGSVGHSYQLELPSQLVRENREALMRGEWYIDIPGGSVAEVYIEGYGTIGNHIEIPDASLITSVVPPAEERRRLQPRRLEATGTRSLLVARISTANAAPEHSASEMQPWFFSTSSYSVVRQYALCSSNLLRFVPYSTPVVNVNVGGSIGSFTRENLVNAAISAIQGILGVSSLPNAVDHVVFVLPSGLPGGAWFATGQTGAWRSIYNNTFASIPNTVMHELGHNLGLGHAGTPGDVYGDLSSLMGYGDYRQFAPSKCFNGYDHFMLGWFTDRTVTINPSAGTQIINLAAFTDYRSTPSTNPVLIVVGSWYLTYNKAEGVNYQTEAAINQVSVELGGVGKSTRMGAIDETTSPFQQANFNGGSANLVIRVCQRSTSGSVNFATVMIGLGSVSCSDSGTRLIPPTPSPVRAPSPSSSGGFALYINAGSSSSYTDSSRIVWAADRYYSGGGTFSAARPIANTNDDTLYQTQRYGQSQYNIPVPRSGNYRVDLYFAEIYNVVHSRGARKFDVAIENSIRFNDVDIFASVGSNKATKKSTVVRVTDGVLNIRFASQVLYPFVSAIAVHSA